MESSAGYTIVLATKAQIELEDSWLWYEERERGLGDKFVDETLKILTTLTAFPEVHSIKNKQYREAIVPKFPFVVVYRIVKVKKLIEVVSVFHTSRNPKRK
ncbi:MAG: type II toxin-antitoxin system RelE/ParE family toxin [Taibaiella sp.]|nr:type II toxin-antitoxin system RelE/ParE family toxin [Taibaiella sp.]